MAEPFLNLRDIGLVFKRIGRRGSPYGVGADRLPSFFATYYTRALDDTTVVAALPRTVGGRLAMDF